MCGEVHPTRDFLGSQHDGRRDRSSPIPGFSLGPRNLHGDNQPGIWAARGLSLRGAGAGKTLVSSVGEFDHVCFIRLFKDIPGHSLTSYN